MMLDTGTRSHQSVSGANSEETMLDLSMFLHDGTEQQSASSFLRSDHSRASVASTPAQQGAGIPPGTRNQDEPNASRRPPPPPMPMLGMFSGTLIPCIQGIIGSIFYLRLAVIVGTSGVGLVLAYLSVAVICVLITSASMGAILSNVTQAGGGPYYLLSRTLGREVGGSVGLVYWLSLVFSAATNILGFSEMLRTHVLPDHLQFTNLRNTDRVVGVLIVTAVLIITTIPSPPTVHRFAAGFGALTFTGLLLMIGSLASASRLADSMPHIVKTIPTLSDSFGPSLRDPSIDGPRKQNTTWIQQFSLLFPMVTGMMAGASKSGIIRHPSATIPRGTLIAIILSTLVYIVTVLLFGFMIRPEALRTPRLHILSLMTWPHPLVGYITTMVATLALAMQSTMGARGILRAMARDRLLSLDRLRLDSRWAPALLVYTATGALVSIGGLNAIAPMTTNAFLITYATLNAATALGGYIGAPWWRPTWPLYHWTLSLAGTVLCLGLMFVISWWVALITIVVAAIVYRVIEVHGAKGSWGAEGWWSLSLRIVQQNLWRLESVPQSAPGFWRPQILAFLPQDRPSSHPHIAALVRQLKKTGGLSIICQCLWGDLDQAVESGDVAKSHQDVRAMLDEVGVEAFVKVTVGQTKLDGMVALLQGAGLGALKPNTVMLPFANPVSCIPAVGLTDSANVSRRVSVDSFSSTATLTVQDGTTMRVAEIPWDSASAAELVKMIRSVGMLEKALLLVKGVDEWPIAVEQHGTIDVYWLVHDGGILRLLPWLLQRHQVWSHCTLRVFAFAHARDDPTAMRRKLEESLTQIRITAQAHVIEIGGQDVSEFAHLVPVVARRMPESSSRESTSELRRRNQVHALVPTGLATLAVQSPAIVRDQMLCKQRFELLNTARHINKLIHEHSLSMHNGLVVCNLPALMPHVATLDYVQYLEILSENVPRMIFVKGNGLEIV